MKKISLIIGVLVLVVFVVYLIFTGEDSFTPKDGNAISGDLAFEDYEGNEVKVSDFTGQPLVLNSWAVWCPFCVEELKEFAQVQTEAGDKVKIIAINRQEPLSKAKNFTDELGLTDLLVFLLDSNDSFYKEIGGFSMPETVFVDAEGNIVFHKRGPMTASEIKSKLESELGITI